MLNASAHETHGKAKACCKGHDHESETAEKLKGLAREAGREARHLLDVANDELQDSAVAKQIKANPVQSGLIALGIGLVAGLFLRRR